MKVIKPSMPMVAVLVSTVLVAGCYSWFTANRGTQKLVDGFAESVCQIVFSNPPAVDIIPAVRIKVEFRLHELFKELSKFGIVGQYKWIDDILTVIQRGPGNCPADTSKTMTRLVAGGKGDYQKGKNREKARMELVRQMKSAVVNMPATLVEGYLSRTIPKINGGVGCYELSEMLKNASATHRGDVIKNVAPYIHRPFSQDCFADLSGLLPRTHASDTMEFLQNSRPKY